ncbi:MAG: hypothetical protein FWH14_02535 [Oscillospiraceae bacterium]|nr:hypothetical protein [Oscillospiraceae bacterium]
MKKLICFIIISVLFLSACTRSNRYDLENIQYGSIEVEWNYWDDARDLIESEYADFIITGKIIGISFQVMNKRTALPPADGDFEYYTKDYGERPEPSWIYELVTLYDVDIITTYKGEPARSTQIRMKGGVKDQYLEEQLALIKKHDLGFIPIYEHNRELKIGETYLFVLSQFENAAPTPLNIDQSIHNITDPFAKAEFEASYNFTAQDIITEFGTDKWDAFYTDWRRDNPDWETRLTGDSLERAKTAEREWTAAR